MKRVFADSFFFVSLLSPKDACHTLAEAWAQREDVRFVTTEYVIFEVGDAFSSPRARGKFHSLMEALRTDPDTEIIPASALLTGAAIELHANHPDKEWSLTDCASFVVMREWAIREALTGDHHFAQAGFNALLRSPGA